MIRILCFLFLVQTLFAGTAVGKVMALEGVVEATAEGGAKRILEKGSSLFLHEVVEVAVDGKIEIKFTDGGVIQLISATQFSVDSYQFEKIREKDRFLGRLLKGGLRYLSGSIAKKHPQETELVTPTATIGLRGTIVEANLIGPALFVGVSEGRAIVSNGAGSIILGKGAEAQFSQVTDRLAPPHLLLQRPPELNPQVFAPPAGGRQIQPRLPPPVQPETPSTPKRGSIKDEPQGGQSSITQPKKAGGVGQGC